MILRPKAVSHWVSFLHSRKHLYFPQRRIISSNSAQKTLNELPAPMVGSSHRNSGDRSSLAHPCIFSSKTSAQTQKPPVEIHKALPTDYKPIPPLALATLVALAKPRLTALVVLSAMSTYALSPFCSTFTTLLFFAPGTLLCAASANSLNMWLEPPFDAQMARTRNRPLPRGLLSPSTAFLFAIGTGASGLSLLFYGVNTTTALLGLGNIVLYAGVYTPMKRYSILNTWVGSLVGAIPPLMGWAATTPDLFSHPGGLLLAGLLFAWQFPHFNSLAWTLRSDYFRAGYRMMSVTNPSLNARVSLRYSLLTFPICFGLAIYGVVDPGFIFSSSCVNSYLTFYAWRFWRWGGDSNARKLFWASLWHLPAVMMLGMLHKMGNWDGILY
ncbi:Protoheme IX farnesyltransferase, mitochondrial [Neolecta irregularis DAH-3]|uniref:Protoheme IX farnesyltransferase, mitochondrial n=1 Tax=Neolecta irregularis (strain DAH-3) TaxID=1198029 RepID=A0A1U7LU36_NEOID|nr:Protoheme IX farnesyltransferase, mitochondrial [Neolecta irregularis DAH-3]|eukprot:OLL26139.1 Protoheme IX farnesyltransferase, mitochondrial [Neolecta irregularis DAH-3]